MKHALLLSLGIVSATVIPMHATAQTYQWKDSNGRTVISDTPPPGNAKLKRALGDAPPATGFVELGGDKKPAEPKTAEPKTAAEKDLDFKKRQQEAKDKADKDAKEQKAAADKRDNCDNARRNLIALESKQPLATLDENGERREMDLAAREREIERARQTVAESCK